MTSAADSLHALVEGHYHLSEELRCMSTTLDRIMALLEAKEERERLATVRLQAAARGIPAHRRVKSLCGEKRHVAIIGGVGSGAPTNSRARLRCSTDGAEDARAA